MENNSHELRKINVYTALTAVAFLFLIFMVLSRLSYLSSQSQIVSYDYNFYTGILPAFLVMYFGIDSIFYLLYRRIRVKMGSYRKVLLSWAILCSIPLLSILFGQSSVLYSDLLLYVTVAIVPFLVSLSMPVVLSVKK
ncbi:MAG: hypothetical protein ACYDCP_06480 [Thermoplasmataceae archaeon]